MQQALLVCPWILLQTRSLSLAASRSTALPGKTLHVISDTHASVKPDRRQGQQGLGVPACVCSSCSLALIEPQGGAGWQVHTGYTGLIESCLASPSPPPLLLLLLLLFENGLPPSYIYLSTRWAGLLDLVKD